MDNAMSKKPIHKIWEDGSETWHLNGFLHREDGPAVIHPDGITEEWWLNGKRHREGAPARIYLDGSERWYLNGRRHCETGPAVIYPDYDNNNGWYLNGENIPFNEWLDRLEISDEEKIELKLKCG